MKDTNNILSYDLWSGQEYNNTTTWNTENSGAIIKTSNIISTIGEQSIQYSNHRGWDFGHIYISPISINSDYTFSFDIYNPHGTVMVRLASNSRLNTLSQVSIPSSDKIQHVILNCTTPSNINALYIQFFTNDSNIFYFDNLSLITG